MKEIIAPSYHRVTEHSPTSIFVGGGISGCPEWQTEIVGFLADQDVVLLNPRRTEFDVADPEQGTVQIKWEYHHLALADMILFWFPSETLCPITLFELGKFSTSNKAICVGTHPDYARRFDVVTQMRLERPDIKVVDSLRDLAEEVKGWLSVNNEYRDAVSYPNPIPSEITLPGASVSPLTEPTESDRTSWENIADSHW